MNGRSGDQINLINLHDFSNAACDHSIPFVMCCDTAVSLVLTIRAVPSTRVARAGSSFIFELELLDSLKKISMQISMPIY